MLPAILRGLAPAPAHRQPPAVSIEARLAALPEAEREPFLLDLVRGEVAAALGHSSAEAIDPDKAFKDLGFDSLAAVDVRNRLGLASGLRLPPTLVFDYPTSAALAGYLHEEIDPSEKAAAGAELEQLERALASIPAGDPSRVSFATHLRALAADLEGGGRPEELAADIDRLESASDQELLDFIDKQVGSLEGD